MAASRYGIPDGAAERRIYASVVAQAFAGTQNVFEPWVDGFGDGVRVLRDGDVCAGLVMYDFAQYYGGASVPCWGIAGVVVRPEFRSKGYARQLMAANLRENFEHGPPLSTLYPAAPKLYRNLGWEFAGSRSTYAFSIPELRVVQTQVTLRPATEADVELMAELYAQRHRFENGCLDRVEKVWERVKRTPKESPICGYIAELQGRPVGYTLYFQKREGGSMRFDLHVRDLVCLNVDAARAFIGFFAGHRSVADTLYFYAAPHDPLLIELQPNQQIRLHERLGWMLRIVRVKEALEARGYASHVKAAAEFKLTDPDLPENDGNWVLRLDDGRMHAEKGGAGDAQLNVRGLAALFASCQAPGQLRAAGLLHGNDECDRALAAMFAGTASWMPDYF